MAGVTHNNGKMCNFTELFYTAKVTLGDTLNASKAECLGSSPGSALLSSFLLMCTLGGNGSDTWVPATDM